SVDAAVVAEVVVLTSKSAIPQGGLDTEEQAAELDKGLANGQRVGVVAVDGLGVPYFAIIGVLAEPQLGVAAQRAELGLVAGVEGQLSAAELAPAFGLTDVILVPVD